MREHGTHVCYVFGPEPGGDTSKGCRCDPCREAATAYERERAQRVAPPYVGAADARAHVRWLSEHGVGLKQIVKVAGVSQGCLWKLMYGRDGKPSKRIRRETRDRILAVMPSDAADGAYVPAAPVWANVHELLDRGWTKAAISKAIGQDGRSLQLSVNQVTAGNARAIAELLDEPVPPRRSRWGSHPVPQPEVEDTPPEIVQLPRPKVPHVSEQPWRARSACRLPNVPPWIFFPGRGDNETLEAAKAVCERCPVAAECLDAHISEKFGIWGNTTEAERRRIRRERGIPEDDEDQEDEVA